MFDFEFTGDFKIHSDGRCDFMVEYQTYKSGIRYEEVKCIRKKFFFFKGTVNEKVATPTWELHKRTCWVEDKDFHIVYNKKCGNVDKVWER